MKKIAFLMLVLLAFVGCYWRPPNAPILRVTYPGDFQVEIGVNGKTPILLHGNAELQADTQELFVGQPVKTLTATAKKVTLVGPYVDLGTLSASIDGSVDAALLGDDQADLNWAASWQ